MLPPDIANRLQFIFARMQARGLLEPIQIFSKQTQVDSTGTPIAKPRSKIATLTGYVTGGGGSTDEAFEGTRSMGTLQLYFLNDASLNDGNYEDRWIVLPNRSPSYMRLQQVQMVGLLYTWALAISGATNDAAGHV